MIAALKRVLALLVQWHPPAMEVDGWPMDDLS